VKIAISAAGATLEAAVDPRFGRCPYFLIVDSDSMEFEAIENPNVALGGGAGIQSAQLVADKGAECVLTGNCGPNAYQTLAAAGISVIVGCSGKAADVVDAFRTGQFGEARGPNVASHFGVGAGASPAGPQGMQQQPPMMGTPGGGMGMGRGRGMGMGRGMGKGMGRGAQGMQAFPGAQDPAQMSKEDQLAMLRQEAEALTQRMSEIQERIKQLEAKEE